MNKYAEGKSSDRVERRENKETIGGTEPEDGLVLSYYHKRLQIEERNQRTGDLNNYLNNETKTYP